MKQMLVEPLLCMCVCEGVFVCARDGEYNICDITHVTYVRLLFTACTGIPRGGFDLDSWTKRYERHRFILCAHH